MESVQEDAFGDGAEHFLSSPLVVGDAKSPWLKRQPGPGGLELSYGYPVGWLPVKKKLESAGIVVCMVDEICWCQERVCEDAVPVGVASVEEVARLLVGEGDAGDRGDAFKVSGKSRHLVLLYAPLHPAFKKKAVVMSLVRGVEELSGFASKVEALSSFIGFLELVSKCFLEFSQVSFCWTLDDD